MLRMITGEVLPDAGTIEIGDTIRIGYLAQEEPDMDTNQRVIDYVKDIAEYVQTRDGRSAHPRCSNASCLLRICSIPRFPSSRAAEKRRLYLLSVLVSGANVLILERAVQQCGYPDADRARGFPEHICRHCVTVSHDRYFLDNVVDRIFEFDGNGNLLRMKAAIPITSRQKNAVLANLPGESCSNSNGKNSCIRSRDRKKRYRYRHGYSFRKRKKQRLEAEPSDPPEIYL